MFKIRNILLTSLITLFFTGCILFTDSQKREYLKEAMYKKWGQVFPVPKIIVKNKHLEDYKVRLKINESFIKRELDVIFTNLKYQIDYKEKALENDDYVLIQKVNSFLLKEDGSIEVAVAAKAHFEAMFLRAGFTIKELKINLQPVIEVKTVNNEKRSFLNLYATVVYLNIKDNPDVLDRVVANLINDKIDDNLMHSVDITAKLQKQALVPHYKDTKKLPINKKFDQASLVIDKGSMYLYLSY